MAHNVWLVLQWREGQAVPEVQGVFDSPALAEAACKSDQYVVMPLTMNEQLPDDPCVNEGDYFPLAVAPGAPNADAEP